MINVNGLTKLFGASTAVDDISFAVEKGEILGFLGPNGAGKSTTMRMITGFLPPTKGTASIAGHDIVEASIEARKKIGYLPENAPVYPDMTVGSYLDFCAEIRGFSGTGKKKAVNETLEKCFLSTVKQKPVHTLSKGYKQRVCFAQSIIHDPDYLIFDEPTDGLDPNQKHEVRQMIKQMSSDKVIIFSTHILDEVDAVCSRAIIISDGKIIADDTPEGLKKKSPGHGAVLITLTTGNPQAAQERFQSLEKVKSVMMCEQNKTGARLRIFPMDQDSAIADAVMETAMSAGYGVESFFIEKGRLDDVFRHITTT